MNKNSKFLIQLNLPTTKHCFLCVPPDIEASGGFSCYTRLVCFFLGLATPVTWFPLHRLSVKPNFSWQSVYSIDLTWFKVDSPVRPGYPLFTRKDWRIIPWSENISTCSSTNTLSFLCHMVQRQKLDSADNWTLSVSFRLRGVLNLQKPSLNPDILANNKPISNLPFTAKSMEKVPYWPEYKMTPIIRQPPLFQDSSLKKDFLNTKYIFIQKIIIVHLKQMIITIYLREKACYLSSFRC